jgi:hypothetical protein
MHLYSSALLALLRGRWRYFSRTGEAARSMESLVPQLSPEDPTCWQRFARAMRHAPMAPDLDPRWKEFRGTGEAGGRLPQAVLVANREERPAMSASAPARQSQESQVFSDLPKQKPASSKGFDGIELKGPVRVLSGAEFLFRTGDRKTHIFRVETMTQPDWSHRDHLATYAVAVIIGSGSSGKIPICLASPNAVTP